MGKFHINDKGDVSVCRASVRGCPVGGDHFDSMEEARKSVEERMGNKFQNLSSLDKKESMEKSDKEILSDKGIDVELYVEGEQKAAARRRKMYEALGYSEEDIVFLIKENEKIRAREEAAFIRSANNVKEFFGRPRDNYYIPPELDYTSSRQSVQEVGRDRDFGINSSGNATARIGHGVTFDLKDGSFGVGGKGFSLDL